MEIADPDTWLFTLLQKTEAEIIDEIKNGKFEPCDPMATFSLFENRNIISKREHSSCKFVIMYRTEKTSENEKWFDTSALQSSQPKSKHNSMFQVASNFNCHENGSERTDLFCGYYLTGLMSDATQGPCASAGAGLAAIDRLAFHNKQNINLIPEYKTMNGKFFSDNDLERIGPAPKYVGLHSNAQALFDRSDYQCVYHKDGPRVDQVFVSSMCIDSYKPKTAQIESVCRELLQHAYDTTYQCAIENKTRVLYLTLVGGGVFNNPMSWIADAIANAHAKYAHLSHLQKVILPIYPPLSRHKYDNGSQEPLSYFVESDCKSTKGSKSIADLVYENIKKRDPDSVVEIVHKK